MMSRSPLPLSPWQQHVQRWHDCQRCHLRDKRDKVVLARGQIPADILFLGEAPGETENDMGQPFTGPAGHLLDDIVDASIGVINRRRVKEGSSPLRTAFTNLICCIPLDDHDQKVHEPDDESVEACAPRLKEFVALADPSLIVCVGRVAWDWTKSGYRWSVVLRGPVREQAGIPTLGNPIPRAQIKHPAALLRANEIQRQLGYQESVVSLTLAIQEHFGVTR